jgi:carboxylesterase
VIIPALFGSAALLGILGRVHRARVQRDLDNRYVRDETGIIRGAHPIALEGTNGAAVLLIHGGGDTPQTMRHLAEVFNESGYTVRAPLLPGHGRNLAAFDASTADSWYAAVQDEFSRLQRSHDWVGVVGLSMGGALSARLAAETQAVGALVLASPYLIMPAIGTVLAHTTGVWGPIFPVIRTASERSVFDPAARKVSLGYGAFTRRSLRALALTASRGFAALPSITAPTLVVQSTTDNRVSTASTTRAFARLGAKDKAIEWIEGAGHVITVDFGWERVASRALDWMERHRADKKTGRPEGAPS